jgi:hypothetical protein
MHEIHPRGAVDVGKTHCGRCHVDGRGDVPRSDLGRILHHRCGCLPVQHQPQGAEQDDGAAHNDQRPLEGLADNGVVFGYFLVDGLALHLLLRGGRLLASVHRAATLSFA